jgi:hypothetical protein
MHMRWLQSTIVPVHSICGSGQDVYCSASGPDISAPELSEEMDHPAHVAV